MYALNFSHVTASSTKQFEGLFSGVKALFKAKFGDLVSDVKALFKGKFANNACEDFDQVSAMVRVLSKSVASSCRLLGEWARAVLRTSRPSPGDSVS